MKEFKIPKFIIVIIVVMFTIGISVIGFTMYTFVPRIANIMDNVAGEIAEKSDNKNQVGRYQFHYGGSYLQLFMIDTKTGALYQKFDSDKWKLVTSGFEIDIIN